MDYFYWNLPVLILIVIAKQMVTSQESARNRCPNNGCYVGVNSNRQFDAFSSDGSRLDNSLNCFAVNTTLYYFCKNVYLEQIDPNNYYRKCTPSGWVNIQNDVVFQDSSPTCKKRKEDCFSPNATEGISIQISGRNVSAEGESTKPLFYLDGTKAIYTCIDPQKKIKIRENNGSDITKITIFKKCSKGSKKWTYLNNKYSEEAELTCVTSNEKDSPTDVTSSSSLSKNDGCRTNGLWYYMLIGGCCLVTLVLIVILIVYRKRLMNISSKKSDVVDGEQTRFSDLGAVVDDLEQSYNTSTRTNPQEHKTQRNGQRAEETLIYENIIPIQVNAEPVYIQVETGNAKQAKKYDKKADGPSNRGKTQASVAARSKVQNDESQTIYAEVQHVKFKNKR